MNGIRDIRSDLKARIELIALRREAEEQRHEGALQGFDREEEAVKAMLALEEELLATGQAQALAVKPMRAGTQNRMESEIIEILSNKKDWGHGEIKGELLARGMGSENDPNFGRSLQGALLSMRSRELVELAGERIWRLKRI